MHIPIRTGVVIPPPQEKELLKKKLGEAQAKLNPGSSNQPNLVAQLAHPEKR